MGYDTASYDLSDTIAAVASAPAGAQRGILRLSGDQVLARLDGLFVSDDGRPLAEIDSPTVLAGRLAISAEGAPLELPCRLMLWPGSASYTRQCVAELHTLGSPPLLEAALAALCRDGARLAEPGEFTLRAFLAGRIDLSQAEAVLGVVDAQDNPALQTALRQLAGGIAQPLTEIRAELLHLLAELEAGLDFVEEDIEFITAEELGRRLAGVAAAVAALQEQMASRGGTGVAGVAVLAGAPNVGKSSLFNALVERYGAETTPERQAGALVSDQRGTTRDYLATLLDLAGIRCLLVDTAGLEESRSPDPQALDEIAAAAQRQTSQQLEQATVRLWCREAGASATRGNASNREDASGDQNDLAAPCQLQVLTKADLQGGHTTLGACNAILTSSTTGQGLTDLAGAIRTALEQQAQRHATDVVPSTADRCRENVRLAAESIAAARELAATAAGEELTAAELRRALTELGKVAGVVTTDDILDRIFSSFCIGK